MKKIFIILFFISSASTAQTVQHSGWVLYFASLKLTDRIGVQMDAQIRSADNYEYIRAALIRPGITYFFTKTQSATAGYLFQETNNSHMDFFGPINKTLIEQDVWEQFLKTHTLAWLPGTHRARLEQRFIEQTAGNKLFSQRFRYLFRYLLPFKKPEGSFSKGGFLALQNEVFFNVQHKERLNNHFFDQDRLLFGLGYRFSKHADVELSYVRQMVNGAKGNVTNHIAQLGVYNRF